MVSAARGEANHQAHAGAARHMQALLAAVDRTVGDAHVRERFGDVGQAFSAALGSWIEPLAEATRGSDSTAHSQAAARAMADLARLTGAFTGEAMQSIARLQTGAADTVPGRRHAEIAGRIDDSFREFSSSPEFDRARRNAAAAILDWLEHDRATAARIACALEPPADLAPELSDDSMPAEPESVLRDGNAALTAYPGAGEARASVLVIPGFTTGPRMFDLDPRRSAVRTLAEHGVDTWLLDWAGAARPIGTEPSRASSNASTARSMRCGRRRTAGALPSPAIFTAGCSPCSIASVTRARPMR